MIWTPTDAQLVAKLDPDVDPSHEAEARARAALVLIQHWIDGPRDRVLLDGAADMLAIACWWQPE